MTLSEPKLKRPYLSGQKLRKWFGPLPGRREAQVMSVMALVAGVILCGLSVFRGFQGQTFMGRPLGGDFVEFYATGKLLNNHQAVQIYDLERSVDLQHAILPTMPESQMLVFGHAPYIAPLFRLFALLPYAWAYIAWLVFSAALYMTSLLLLFRSAGLPRAQWKIAGLLAISSMPFLYETWIGGQLSVVVFFIWTLFFYSRHKNWPFLAGIALSCCLFKPTLVVLPALVLLCARKWRMIGGLIAGACALALASIGVVGLAGCRAWIDKLFFLAWLNSGPGEPWHLAKLVDIASFLHLLIRNAPIITGILSSVIIVAVFALLGRAWFSPAMRASRSAEDLLWAATVCFTLVANSYSPIYDSILAVSAVVLVASAVDRREQDRETFQIWLLGLYMVPWLTQSSAEFLHVQLFTILLGGFGAWALQLGYRERQTLLKAQAEVLAIQ